MEDTDVSVVIKRKIQREWSVYRPGFGAVSIWASPRPDDYHSSFRDEKWFGGVEVHYEKQPKYSNKSEPSQPACMSLLGLPCWHDGSSLLFTERYAHRIDDATDDEMLNAAAYELDRRQADEEDDES